MKAFDAVAHWVPSLYWIPKYNSWVYFQADLIAGLTLSAVVIPQSLAYSALASLPPVYGLYVALVPPLVYAFLGMTPYNSLGTMAILSILIAESLALADGLVSLTEIAPLSFVSFHILVAIFLCFLVGLGQLLIACTGAGTFLSTHIFRTAFVSSFTSGSAVVILTSQLKPFFGFTIPKYNGLFSTPKTWFYVVTHMNTLHGTTVAVGLVSVLLIVGIRQVEIWIRRWVLKRNAKAANMPFDKAAKPMTIFPEVLFTVAVVTLCTTALNLPKDHGLEIIGYIPSGLPPISLPWDLVNNVSSDTAQKVMVRLIPNIISIILVSTVLLTSIVTAFPSPILIKNPPKKANPSDSVDLARTLTIGSQYLSNSESPINQEIFAVAVSSVVASFFSCFPPTASLSKAAILAKQTNVRSPLGNFFSVIVVAISVSFLASWFENIPMTVLAAIIIVAIIPVAARANLIFSLIQKAKAGRKRDLAALEMRARTSRSNTEQVVAEATEQTVPAPVEEDSGQDMALGDGVFIVKEVVPPSLPVTNQETDSGRTVNPTSNAQTSPEPIDGWKKAACHCHNWCDPVVWCVTFFPVVLLDVGTGIYIGLGFVILIKCIELGLEWKVKRWTAEVEKVS